MKYYYADGNTRRGPYELEALKKKGCVKPDTLVWRSGLSDWVEASSLPELGVLFVSKNANRSTSNQQQDSPGSQSRTAPARQPESPYLKDLPSTSNSRRGSSRSTSAHSGGEKKTSGSLVIWCILGVVVLLVIVMLFSNPDLKAHQKAVRKALLEKYVDVLPTNLQESRNEIEMAIGDYTNKLIYTNYFLFSTSNDPTNDGRLSFGLFGSVSPSLDGKGLALINEAIHQIEISEEQRRQLVNDEILRMKTDSINEAIRQQQALQDSINAAAMNNFENFPEDPTMEPAANQAPAPVQQRPVQQSSSQPKATPSSPKKATNNDTRSNTATRSSSSASNPAKTAPKATSKPKTATKPKTKNKVVTPGGESEL